MGRGGKKKKAGNAGADPQESRDAELPSTSSEASVPVSIEPKPDVSVQSKPVEVKKETEKVETSQAQSKEEEESVGLGLGLDLGEGKKKTRRKKKNVSEVQPQQEPLKTPVSELSASFQTLEVTEQLKPAAPQTVIPSLPGDTQRLPVSAGRGIGRGRGRGRGEHSVWGAPPQTLEQQHPVQQHPGQQRPVQPYPGLQHPGQPQPGQPQPWQSQPWQSQPGQPQPWQPQPGQQHPGQQHPGQQRPAQPYPGLQHPGQQQPGQPQPWQSQPGQPQPGQQHPAQQHPGQQRPAQQHPGQQRPAQQHPGQQHPGQQRPAQPYPGQQQSEQQSASSRSPSIASTSSTTSSQGAVCRFKIPARINGNTIPARRLTVLTNYLEMKIKDIKVYRYDVSIKPDRPKKLTPKAFAMARSIHFPKSVIAYDQRKNCFALTPLWDPSKDRVIYNVEILDDNKVKMPFEVTLIATGIVDLGTITNHIRTGGSSLNTPSEAIQCIDVILQQGTLENYVKVGRQFFKRPSNPIDLGFGLEMWTGLFQSAIFTWRPFINIDVAHKGFPKGQSLLNALIRDFQLNPKQPLEQQRGFNIELFHQFIKGLRMNYSANPMFKHFKLEIGNEFFKVDAKVLEAPKLNVGTGRFVAPRNGSWQANRFLKPSALDSWGLIAVDADPNACRCEDLLRNIKNVAKNMGMAANDATFFNFNVRSLDLKKTLCAAMDKRVNFMFIIVGGRDRNCYHKVKRIAELEVGILTQCIKEFTAKAKMSDQTLRNILLKVNSKLSGVNQALDAASVPRCIREGGVMMVGADVTHPSPDQMSVPSIAAVTASIDGNCFEYNIELSVQAAKAEIIVDFEDMMYDHLLVYRKRQRSLPRKIYVFRDGVSEGQFKLVMNSELVAIQNAYSRLEKQVKPEIMFLLVQKRHHTRFFLGENQRQNVEPGTVVDTEIVHRSELDFYLVSHAAIKGTARPTRYHAVANGGGVPSDEVEQLTYYLCHLYSRCMRSVSYPTPTYYAHLACMRARSLTFGDHFNNNDLEKKPKRLRVLDKILDCSRMFFV